MLAQPLLRIVYQHLEKNIFMNSLLLFVTNFRLERGDSTSQPTIEFSYKLFYSVIYMFLMQILLHTQTHTVRIISPKLNPPLELNLVQPL